MSPRTKKETEPPQEEDPRERARRVLEEVRDPEGRRERAREGLVEMLRTGEFPVRTSYVYSCGFNIDTWFRACAEALEELAGSLLGEEIKEETAKRVAEVLGWEGAVRRLDRDLAEGLGLVWYAVMEGVDLEDPEATALLLEGLEEVFTEEDRARLREVVGELLRESGGKVRWEEILRLPEVE
jgi:hypothetical protein